MSTLSIAHTVWVILRGLLELYKYAVKTLPCLYGFSWSNSFYPYIWSFGSPDSPCHVTAKDQVDKDPKSEIKKITVDPMLTIAEGLNRGNVTHYSKEVKDDSLLMSH